MRQSIWLAVGLGLLLGGLPGEAQQAQPTLRFRLAARSGSITLKVPHYPVARQQVVDHANRVGAEVLHSRTDVDPKGRSYGWLRLRLAAGQLPALLPLVRSVGQLYGEKLDVTDHSSEYEELGRRAERLGEHQDRLDGILRSPRRLRGSDLLYVQERTFRAGVDEGLLRQRRADLERSGQVSTLVVFLFEPDAQRTPDTGNWFGAAMERARTDAMGYLRRAATGLAYLLVFAPVWIPGVVGGLFVLRYVARRLRPVVPVLVGWLRDVPGWLRPPPPATPGPQDG
ncbi:MAG: DUF4349 domain-containing protein [Armatimonadetes bacterium]|nr:DUF4349 domain-containing protein [Armatimonadota bacterium]